MNIKDANECPRCNKQTLELTSSLIVTAPFEFFRNLSKQNLRRADVRLHGALWSGSLVVCNACGFVLMLSNQYERDSILSFLVTLRDDTTDAIAREKITEFLNELEEFARLKAVPTERSSDAASAESKSDEQS